MIRKIIEKIHLSENIIAFIVLFFLALFPTLEIIARIFKTGIPSSSTYIQHLVLWITFIGGMITSREGRHLALTVGVEIIPEKARQWIRLSTAVVAAAIAWAFAWSSLSFALIGFDPTMTVGIFPIKIVAFIMPVGYGIMGLRFVTILEARLPIKIAASVICFLMGIVFAFSPISNIISLSSSVAPGFIEGMQGITATMNSAMVMPIIVILIIAGLLGTPIFIVLGGIAYMLFVRSGGSLEVIPNEAYTMLIGEAIPAIPLFTFAGFILSESKSGERLVTLFKALFGWLPGGMGIVAILVCTFFTTFTGASGVTILALGGLLSVVLIRSGRYSENFTYGLLTASGSIGLLFPPSLPIILYGVVAQISIKEMFVGGIIPGIVMVTILSLYSIIVTMRKKVERTPFHVREALSAVRGAMWEILLPVIIVVGFFSGFTTIVETGAVAVLYSLVIVLFVHRDIKIRNLPDVMLKSIPIIGGVLVILALARGLSYYIVDAEIPMSLSLWVKAHIHSKILFLILLNLALLITGCLMDIFSAIMVVVPLIIPLGAIFGIHPVHLGIIFLANLELGYLTPPVGLNLFLASYRFEQPLSKIYRNVVPFLLVLLGTVLIITYVPWISTGLLGLMK